MSLLVIFFLSSNASAFFDCIYIYNPGEYVLSQDIIINSSPYSCINIYTSDVIINGNGHSIEGNGRIGVAIPGVNGSSILQNVTIKNLTITGWFIGISIGRSNNNLIFRNNISNNYFGIYIIGSANQIYDNYFNNSINAKDFGPNSWNTTKQAGINIIRGPYHGGNYWSDYAGNDTDGDGLGNELIPYNSQNNIIIGGDYLPLTTEKVAQVVLPGETITTNPEGNGPTAFDPVETSVTIPSGGNGTTISIEETSSTQLPPEGYFLIGQEISISAPDTGATTLQPLVIDFEIDSTFIPLEQTDMDNIKVYRNGVEVMDCVGINPIVPDPCIFERVYLPASGDGRITVFTSSASEWRLFKPFELSPLINISNLIDNIENLNLQKGIDNSLDAKLYAARNALQDVNLNNNAAAINSLEAFINAVEAQRGKLIDNNDADKLIGDARFIIDAIRI